MTKAEIRKIALKARNALPDELRRFYSVKIAEKLYKSPHYISSKVILLYANTGSEVSTDSIFENSIAKDKLVYYPRVCGENKMDFYQVDSLSQLDIGAFGIREPMERPNKFDTGRNSDSVLVIMPGVAFDPLGNRIGYGRGYYDRFLARLNFREYLTSAALCFSCQLYEGISADAFDVKADIVISEE